MTATALPENYCVCVGDDGAPREIARSGIAVTYKAMGYQSGRPVALQLIPLSSVSQTGRAQFELKIRAVRKLKHPNIARLFDVREEDEHLVLATEFLQGETAERWVVTHGPMPPDAVLRIGVQVVSALAEAAFHSLSHRAIQPSNLMIVSGATPDGDWPFVKLLHFGLAGLKLYSDGKEVVPAIGAAFASPERLENGKVDFRSEIFSLGATMCFLLTGDVPLPGRSRKSGPGECKLPNDVPIPRPVRHLLRHLLRVNPDERPNDPLLVTDELRTCLKKVEHRGVFRRRASGPLDAEPASETAGIIEASESAPKDRPHIFGAILTGLTTLILLGVLGMILLPGEMRWWTQRNRPLNALGVPVGIDENAPVNKETEPASPVPIAESSPSIAPAKNDETNSAVAEQSPTSSSPLPAASEAPEPSNTPVISDQAPEPSTPPVIAGKTPEPSAAPVTAENSPASEAAVPNAPADSSPNPSPSASVEESPQVPPETETQPPTEVPSDTPSATPAEINPSPPGEGPPPIAAASPPAENATEKPAMIQPEPPPSEGNRESFAAASPASTPIPKTAKSTASSRRSSKRASEGRAVPIMRINGERAQRVGITNEGDWILRLPSGETIVAPPPPEIDEALVISHRKVRKVKTPPRALPVDNRPPVIVLPPEN